MQRPSVVGKYLLPGTILSVVVFFGDQFTKWLVMEGFLRTSGPSPDGFLSWLAMERKVSFFIDERDSFNTLVLTPFLNLVMVWNQGISFGLFSQNTTDMMSLVFIGISLLASLGMLIWLALTTRRVPAWALSLIIGGAIGNAADRIRFGAVADFVDLHVYGWHWPAFNLADSAIVIGAALMIWDTFTADGGTHENKRT